MALSEIQQANNIINRAMSVLLMVPAKPTLDSVASMIALYCSLQPDETSTNPSTQRIVDEISPAHVPASLQFLAGSSQIKTEPVQKPQLVVDVAGPHTIDSVHQEQLQGGMRLHVSFPPATDITKDNIETTIRMLPYDVAIVIGAADLEELGTVFTKNADFFYNTPLLNIDHRAANEHFGTVNLVDITAGSCAEVVHELIAARTQQSLDPKVATALYAGIVAGTDSFQNPSTTPRSFQAAAHLIEQKADREAVIQYLVKTKPLKLIKLVGSVYAHLQYEEGSQLYWTILEKNDFQESSATADDIPAVMNELANNIAGFNIAFLLYEDPAAPASPQEKRFYIYVRLGNGLKPRRKEIQAMLAASKQNGALVFDIIAPSIESAEKTTHNKIRQILP